MTKPSLPLRACWIGILCLPLLLAACSKPADAVPPGLSLAGYTPRLALTSALDVARELIEVQKTVLGGLKSVQDPASAQRAAKLFRDAAAKLEALARDADNCEPDANVARYIEAERKRIAADLDADEDFSRTLFRIRSNEALRLVIADDLRLWAEADRKLSDRLERLGEKRSSTIDARTAAAAMLRNIASAEVAYSSKIGNNGNYGSFRQLVDQGFLDSRFGAYDVTVDGFRFRLEADGSAFRCVARGTGPHAGALLAIDQNLVVCTDEACRTPLSEMRAEAAPAAPAGEREEGEEADEPPAGASPATSPISLLQRIARAQDAYAASHDGAYGSFAELAAAAGLDVSWRGDSPTVGDFQYVMDVSKGRFRCLAFGRGLHAGEVYAVDRTGVVFTDAACTRPLR